MNLLKTSIAFQILVLLLLTIINALFAASEMAFVSINRAKIARFAEQNNKKAQRVLLLLENSDDFLTTVQVVITLVGFLASALAATTLSRQLIKYLPFFPGRQVLATLITTVILAYIFLVLGELYPKKIASQMPEKVAMATSGIVYMARKFFSPFLWLLSVATNLLQKITPINFSETREKFTRDEMKAVLSESRKTGGMELEELSMMEGILSLDSKTAREVMVPRTDTEMLNVEVPFAENLKEIIESPYSRLPLYYDEKDNIIGIIHVKNLFKAVSENREEAIDLEAIAAEPLFVPATIYIDDLLIEFQKEQQHMAILIDEYGGVEGIATMEDLLEEIVGEIDDETDVEEAYDIRRLKDGSYYLNGTLTIEDYNEFFGEHLYSDEFDTIAGLVIESLGYVPRDDDQVTIRVHDNVWILDQIEKGRIYGIILKVDPDRAIETTIDIVETPPPSDYEE